MYTSLYAHFGHTCLAMVVAKCSLLALSNPTRVVYTSPTRSCSTSPDAFIPYKDVDINFCRYSLVPRTSPAPVFDENFFAYCKQSKTGAGEGLETRLVQICSSLKNLLRILSTKLTDTQLDVEIKRSICDLETQELEACTIPCWHSSLLCWQWHKMGLLEMGVPGYSICLPAPASKEGLDSHWRIPSLTRVEVYMWFRLPFKDRG